MSCHLRIHSRQDDANETPFARYHSVRLDVVHYCSREWELSDKRKRGAFFDRNGKPKDPTQQRLKLFSEAVRRNGYLGSLVEILKMPYMTRQAYKADLARTVSVLLNLRYVDLPDGLFSDDASALTLREELQWRCPEIRRMKYLRGSEQSFATLAQARIWQNLEILEIKGLAVEAETLLYVLASFPSLHELKLGEMQALDDILLTPNSNLPPFPPITTLALENAPRVTAAGMEAYLSRPETREVLENLALSETGILPQELHTVLASATHLKTLTINETVSRSFPIAPVPPLASSTLQTLRFLFLNSSNAGTNPHSETYYNYLATSLLSGSLSALISLFAYSPSLPDLLLYPPTAPFGTGGNNTNNGASTPSRFSSYSATSSTPSSIHLLSAHSNLPIPTPLSGLSSPLALYTKPPTAPELEWSLTTIDPPSERNGRRGSASATRPLSFLQQQQRSSSPHSVRSSKGGGIGGGFLTVPGEEMGGLRVPGNPVVVPSLELGAASKHEKKLSKNKGSEWMG